MLKQGEQEFTTLVCLTAQHQIILDQLLTGFDIQNDIVLNLMKNRQDLIEIKSSVIFGMRVVLLEQRPDLVLVHIDTSISSAASIYGFCVGIALEHVETELLTHNILSPFPEEFNRHATCLDDIRTRL